MTTIDFGKALQDAKGASFEALPVGDYDVEVAKADAVTSQNGKPMIKTTFRVVTGPYERRPIINQFVLSIENPQAVAIFFRHMKAFGLTEEWFASLGRQPSLDPVASALVGRRARLSLGHRDWQGETRNEVKAVKPYTGAPPQAGPATGGPLSGPPVGGPAPLPPAPGPVAGPTPPSAPAPVAPSAPVAPPVSPPPAAPPLPAFEQATAATASAPVQSVPQPPAPAVPTSDPATPPSAPAYGGGEAAQFAPSPSTDATSDEASPAPQAPPALPY